MATRAPNTVATLKDVAHLAGVSTATVARVVHGNGYVADETRRLVEAAIAETGYQLNVVAQGLRKRRTLVLGHVLMAIDTNPFFAGVAKGVEEEAARHGCGVITVTAHNDPAVEQAAVQTLVRRRVDAILFTTARHEASVELARAANIPIVQVERAGMLGTHEVTVDNYRGAVDAIEHLVHLGHRRIACLGVNPDVADQRPFAVRRQTVERERLSGYCDALRNNGLAVRDVLVDLDGDYFDLNHARAVTRRWLSLEESPTAIFATCDFIAAGVLQELYAAGMRVPCDMSLVGFDDTLAQQLSPPLTTVAQPMLEIGRVAATIAIEESWITPGQTPAPSLRKERLNTRLVIRESTGKVRDNA
jgi:DNA-binding LacI/PurR family transcriptional regulator